MNLLAYTKRALRLTGNAWDEEIELMIQRALADMRRVGVDPVVLEQPIEDPNVIMACVEFVKGHLGLDLDVENAEFWQECYRREVCDLLHSKRNLVYQDQLYERRQEDEVEQNLRPDFRCRRDW